MTGFDVSFGPPHPPEGNLQSDVAWSAELWAMLRDGGVWGVPRSGVIFQKREAAREFAVIAVMPWSPEMEGTVTAAELAEQQRTEIDGIRARFEQLGITVPEEASA